MVVVLVLILGGTSKQLASPIYIPASGAQGCLFSTPSPTLSLVSLIVAVLTSGRWCISVMVICISLMMSEVHLVS